MICSVCKYEWCWICGFQDYNGEGSKPESFNFHFFIVFQCNIFGMLTFLPWYWAILAGILIFSTLPLLIFFFTWSISVALFHDTHIRVPSSKHNRVTQYMALRNHKTKTTVVFVWLPLWLLLITVFGALSFVFTVIITIPFYILSVFVFIRMIWYWNTKRRVE